MTPLKRRAKTPSTPQTPFFFNARKAIRALAMRVDGLAQRVAKLEQRAAKERCAERAGQ